MRFLIHVSLMLTLCVTQIASAKTGVGKYQRLSLQMEDLCKKQASVEEFVSCIRRTGGFRPIKGTLFVGKAGAVNFGRVRLKILESGEWDLVTEEPTANLQSKTEHFAPKSDFQLFAFLDSKPVDPFTLTKTDRPTLVIFTPSKVIAVRTGYDKTYYLLDRPDHNFAEVTHQLKSRLGI